MATEVVERFPVSDNDDEEEMEDDLPCTQPVEKPLAGVMAFVDVRLGRHNTINTGQSISEKLIELGANIAPKLTKNITHLVFKDGKTNLDKVDRKSIFVVSPLWVESCARCNEQVSEIKYPIITKSKGGLSTAPGSPVVLGKIKRVKSMQPKPIMEEEVTKSVERNRKRMMAVVHESASKRQPVVPSDPFAFTLSEEEDNESVIHNNKESTPIQKVISNSKEQKTPSLTKSVNNSSAKPPLSRNKLKKTQMASKKKTILKSRDQNAFIDTDNSKTPKKKSPSACKKISPKVTPQVNPKVTPQVKKDTPTKENLKATPGPSALVKSEGGVAHSRRSSRSSFCRQLPSIVLTSLEQKDRETVVAVIRSLGGFELSQTVNDTTTHLLCGAARRTVNALAGTVKGCWLLSVDWVWSSLEAGKWMPEEAFEMVTEFPAAQYFRLERCQAGVLYRPSLFHKCGSIYLSADTKPSPQNLEMLLQIAGAKVTGSKVKADVCVGRCASLSKEETKQVSEQWIIDSITEHVMLPIEEYILNDDGSFVRSASPEL